MVAIIKVPASFMASTSILRWRCGCYADIGVKLVIYGGETPNAEDQSRNNND